MENLRHDLEEALRHLTTEPIGEVVDNLINLFENNYDRPNMEGIGFGAFKEAYESAIPGIVFKFCTQANPTEQERYIIEQAKVYGVSKLFCPTEFVQIPKQFIAYYIADSDEDRETYDSYYHTWVEDEDYEYPVCNYLEIQPFCSILSNFNGCSKDFLAKIDTGKISYLSSRVHLNWLEDVYNVYGEDMLYRLNDFCKEYKIRDLHADNIGHYNKDGKEYPVILDWLSGKE